MNTATHRETLNARAHECGDGPVLSNILLSARMLCELADNSERVGKVAPAEIPVTRVYLDAAQSALDAIAAALPDVELK